MTHHTFIRRAGAALVAAALASAPAAAQWNPVVYGSAEVDSEDFAIYLAGVGVSPGGIGLHPSFGVNAYHLRYPAGMTVDGETVTAEQNAVAPMVGLRRQWAGAAASVHVGYLFTDSEDDAAAIGSPSGGGDGVITNAQINYWGQPGGLEGEAIASYNWDADYVWTRFRGLREVMRVGAGGAVLAGIEAQFQGGLDEDGYEATQVGALLAYRPSAAYGVTLGVGGKTDNRETDDDVFPYARLDFVLFP